MAVENTDMFTPLGLLNSPIKLVKTKGGYSTPLSFSGSINRDDKIHKIRVLNAWIGHGAISGFFSIFTAPLAGSAITHWWVEIQTKEGHWYIAQWEPTKEAPGDRLFLRRRKSQSAVTEAGKAIAGAKKGEWKEITPRKTYTVPKDKKRSIGDLIDKCMKKQGRYNLVGNNCQHFGLNVYNWI